MRKSSSTIIDVAQFANVSVGTVSNVINGTRDVSQTRRQRVLDAIEHLDFKQNMLAQGLRRNSSAVVGLCVPLTSTSYFSALVDAFEGVAATRHIVMMQALTRQDPDVEYERIEKLLRYRVGGILLIPSAAAERSYDLIEKSGVPLVVVDRPAAGRGFDQVIFANRPAMRETMVKLIGLGHRRILFCVQQPELSVTIDRCDGLNQAIRESQHAVVARMLVCATAADAFMEQIRDELAAPHPPTAIIVSNSHLAAWIVRGLQDLNVRYPQEVSLLAFGAPNWAELVTPKLSVVEQPIKEIASSAWDRLVRRMSGDVGAPYFVEIAGRVIMRDSVGPPPRGATPPSRSRYI